MWCCPYCGSEECQSTPSTCSGYNTPAVEGVFFNGHPLKWGEVVDLESYDEWDEFDNDVTEWLFGDVEDIHPLHDTPSRVSSTKAQLQAFGGKLTSLYDSAKWETPSWNRSTERSWKRHRSTQYKGV